jgi:hypothetical protein
MAEIQTPPRFCSDLLGLYYIDPNDEREHIVYAFSFDIQILEKMILDNFTEEDRHYYSIKPIVIYTYVSFEKEVIENREKLNKMFGRKNARGIIMKHLDYNNIKYPLYGYYKNCECEGGIKEQQVILSIENPKIIINKLISENPINIDTFYDEGIINS